MAGIGQLSAGVAHEINNPIGFVGSNLDALTDYMTDVDKILEHYKNLIKALKNNNQVTLPDEIKTQLEDITQLEEDIEIRIIPIMHGG